MARDDAIPRWGSRPLTFRRFSDVGTLRTDVRMESQPTSNPADPMYFFVLDAVAVPHGNVPEQEGFAVVWVNSARYADCERAALEFAGARGLTVRAIQTTHKPTAEELDRMSPTERAARTKGFHDGVWGYFVPRRGADPATDTLT